jgi:lipopolysaccharide/colanic/teichoic acid biosynthesis glycosyltransferase
LIIRFLDIIFSIIGLVFSLPVLALVSLWILLDSKGGILYKQVRVGKNNQDFHIIKFRTMRVDADKRGGLTIGSRDSRITRAGLFLRRYKLDELPQLFNVLRGEMSMVGPRPEIRKYVDLYSDEEKKVLQVRPGITDWASIEYIHENEILGNSADPEQTYIHEVMPAKLRLNQSFINDPSVARYFEILGKTIKKVVTGL